MIAIVQEVPTWFTYDCDNLIAVIKTFRNNVLKNNKACLWIHEILLCSLYK